MSGLLGVREEEEEEEDGGGHFEEEFQDLSHHRRFSLPSCSHYLPSFCPLSLSLSLSRVCICLILTQFNSMETAAALRSFHRSAGCIPHAYSPFEKPGLAAWPTVIRLPSVKRAGMVLSCSKTPEATVSNSSVSLDNPTNGSTERRSLRNTTFPNAFEVLLLEVCDETSIAELHLKVGDFEMHLKRNVEATNSPVSVAPPIPSEPMVQSAPAAPSTSTPKPSPEKANPFASASSALASKLAALEASGTDGYKLVTSPTVGSFRKGRTVKGKKQPPMCKQGDIIKEGQVIGYIDQFGTELPVKSDVAGEVLKILFDEGEAVGYGDPLIAVLPSFHGLNL